MTNFETSPLALEKKVKKVRCHQISNLVTFTQVASCDSCFSDVRVLAFILIHYTDIDLYNCDISYILPRAAFLRNFLCTSRFVYYSLVVWLAFAGTV